MWIKKPAEHRNHPSIMLPQERQDRRAVEQALDEQASLLSSQKLKRKRSQTGIFNAPKINITNAPIIPIKIAETSG